MKILALSIMALLVLIGARPIQMTTFESVIRVPVPMIGARPIQMTTFESAIRAPVSIRAIEYPAKEEKDAPAIVTPTAAPVYHFQATKRPTHVFLVHRR
jgi:hypothetical protein